MLPELQQPNIVGNFLSAYGTAQAQQQAQQDREFNKQRVMRQDDMAEQQFGMQKQAQQFKLAEEVVNMLGSVQDGDEMGFERAKQRWAQMGLPPEAVAGYTVADLPMLRVKAGTQLRELQAQQVRAQTAAANRSNRGVSGGNSRTGPVAIDPVTGEPLNVSGMANVKLTEGQSKDIGFLRRAQEANAQLDDKKVAGLTNTKDAIARSVPVFGRALQSDQSRQGMQVGKNFLAAVLRKDTGAAVTDTEFDFYSDIFIPQWGDDDGTLQLKARARSAFLEGLRAGMSNGAALAQMGVIPPPELAPREDEAQGAPAPQGQPAPAAGAPQGATRRIRFDANGNMVQ